ncbi:uncharacterized protein ASCRUDRAFT_69956 [Ascoidea rubescens DSM 1968]|uniref:DUF1168-domain-containing protein n=1 Tax=Ascoidea rubescens DSM 1968 TaxID=1344418 RepID=A0A1D2VIS9_9ASCO|nr:hypothetical protein ASCRUDRAFT_69956 [Ascoidea rubescens DSM 1968]ODV61460.1 hypothetical protein ASCRUDRAFT_69956 [Ascoidea rubescens DSM 1968]
MSSGRETVSSRARDSKNGSKGKVIANDLDLQRFRINKLMSNPSKELKIDLKSVERKLPSIPDYNFNVKSSIAGAGSDGFHIYQKSKEKEKLRLSILKENETSRKNKEEFLLLKQEMQKKDDLKTQKNRLKRLKRKQAKEKYKKDNITIDNNNGVENTVNNDNRELNRPSNKSIKLQHKDEKIQNNKKSQTQVIIDD